MKQQSLSASIHGILFAALTASCGAQDADDAEQVGSAAYPLAAWANGNLSQVLRVNAGQTTVRNICELTIPISSMQPMAFLASGSGSPVASVGWMGSAVSVAGLEVSGCSAYPCEVVARYRGTASNGSALGCTISSDNSTSRFVGTSSGTALTVISGPAATIIVNQDVKIGPAGTPIAGSCVFRQSAELVAAEVTNFQVFVNGTNVVDLPGPTAIGDVPWPTGGPAVPFGALYVGSEAGATRLKHVIAKKKQLVAGDALRCQGVFASQSGTPVFDVNVTGAPSGNGLTLVTAPTEWTCSPSMFGGGNGCDCGCGTVDPDCGANACVCGNGVREGIEECDDGGGANLDGCDSTCRFEQIHRANYLQMQSGTDTFCTANRLAHAFASIISWAPVQSGLDTSIANGSTSWIMAMSDLDDLTGESDPSVQLGMLSGTPAASPGYSGTSDLDWWYTIESSFIDANRQSLNVMPASIEANVLNAGPSSFILPLGFGTIFGPLYLSNARMTVTIGATSVPTTSAGSPPGHLVSEHLDPNLASFATMGQPDANGAGKLCGNARAASLASVPIHASLHGCIACSKCYTPDNTLLDLIVGGCGQIMAPTQPDTFDASAPVAGAGGPYTLLVNNTTQAVVGCVDKNNAPVDLATCLNAAAYSTFFKFTTDRIIAK